MRQLSNLFLDVVNVSIMASFVIGFVMLARLLLRKAPKVFSYALWGIVLVRLLIPLSIQSPVSVIPVTPSVEQYHVNQALPEVEFELPIDHQTNLESQMNAPYHGGVVVQVKRSLEPAVYLSLIWVGGMLLMGLYSGVSYGKIRRKVRVSVPLRDHIYLADDIRSPFVIGLIRPKIYLPENLGEQEMEYILLHEEQHIHRLDHWAKALAFLALTVHWFNPLVWAAFSLAAKDMEMSCDEAVIRKAGGEIRAAYSASLLTFATGKRILAGTPLAFGEGDTKGRIRNLANWKRPGFWVILLVLILCVVLAVCLLTDPVTETGAGVTWYYGTVVDSAMSVVEEGDRTGRSYITMECDDGETRLFWLAKGCEKPENVLGQYVVVRSVTEHGTGLTVTSSIQIMDQGTVETLDEAIHSAIIAHNSGKYLEGQCNTAHFKELSREERGSTLVNGIKSPETITVYGIALYREYSLNGELLEDTSGSCCPVVLTFSVDNGGNLSLSEYWEPRDGTYYPIDIRTKFRGRPWPDTQQYITEQVLHTYGQAMEYFGIGPDVVVRSMIADICVHAQWTDGFGDLVEHCNYEFSMLEAYGTHTLDYCFSRIAEGGQDDLAGQVMAYACERIMESAGEELIADWSYTRSGQDWFLHFTSRALSLVLSQGLTPEEISDQYPVSYHYLDRTGAFGDHPAWGLTMEAEQVNPNGLVLVFTQNGLFPAESLMTGQPFGLQESVDGQWQSVPTVLEDWAWTTEGFLIPLNDTIRMGVSWSWIYGELEPGIYRICKQVTAYGAAVADETATYYAEFVIS